MFLSEKKKIYTYILNIERQYGVYLVQQQQRVLGSQV